MEICNQEQCTVSGPLVAVVWLSRCVGLAPLRLQRLRGDAHRLRVHTPLHIISSLIITVFNFIGMYLIFPNVTISNLIAAPINKFSFWVVLIIANKICVSTLLSVLVYGGNRRMRRLISIVHYMQQVSSDVGGIQFKIWKLWVVFIGAFGIHALLIYRIFHKDYFYSYMNLLPPVMVLGAVIHHALFNIALFLYVETINRGIQEMFSNKNSDITAQEPRAVFSISQNRRRQPNENVANANIRFSTNEDINAREMFGIPVRTRRECVHFEKLAKCYLAICNVVHEIYNSEGGLMLLLMSNEVLAIFVNIVYIISFIEGVETSAFILHASWVLAHFANIIALVEPCHRLQQEMLNTKALLSQWICRLDARNNMRQELDRFITQFMMRAPSCAPLGICTFNRSLLATITAVVTTLLIIILQFQLRAPPINK